jgi:hypothetical protein
MSSRNTQLCLANEWGPCPPDGFRYVDPVDGFIAHAWTYVDWVDIQARHLQVNNREIPLDLGAQMQNQLCQSLPPGWCRYDDDNRPRPTLSLSYNDVAGGLKTFARWIAGGCKYVSQEEADRRALICSRCYLNVNVQGCAGCQQAIQEVVRDKHSKHDASINTCAVCKCFLQAKVHFPIETLDTESQKVQSMYPGFCWLNKESENFHGGKEELDPRRGQPKAQGIL